MNNKNDYGFVTLSKDKGQILKIKQSKNLWLISIFISVFVNVISKIEICIFRWTRMKTRKVLLFVARQRIMVLVGAN